MYYPVWQHSLFGQMPDRLAIPTRTVRASDRRISKRAGAAAAEFAILLPFLTFAFLAAVDVARAFYCVIIIDNCAYNGASYGAQVFDNGNQQWVNGQTEYWQTPTGQVTTEQGAISLDGVNLNPALTTANMTVTNSTDADGNAVNIAKVTYTFNSICGSWLTPGQINITRTRQMRIAPGVPP